MNKTVVHENINNTKRRVQYGGDWGVCFGADM